MGNKVRNKVNISIRLMKKEDKSCIINMMREFYNSPAVWSNGSEEIYSANVDNCVNSSPYLEGYVFEDENGIHGYAMIAKSYSTEFGKPCIWIEDLFVSEIYRKKGIGSRFLDFIMEKYEGSLFRLEVEDDNKQAISVYEDEGFSFLPYLEMKR